MIRLLQIRDKKEASLRGLLESRKDSEFRVQEFKAEFDKKLDSYKKWKLENKVEGLLF